MNNMFVSNNATYTCSLFNILLLKIYASIKLILYNREKKIVVPIIYYKIIVCGFLKRLTCYLKIRMEMGS